MSINSLNHKTDLFLVRVRTDGTRGVPESGNEQWFGQVQHVVTGEAYDFRGWAELIRRLALMLNDPDALGNTDEQS